MSSDSSSLVNLNYKVPQWASGSSIKDNLGRFDKDAWNLEVIKGGTSIEIISLGDILIETSSSFLTIGRVPLCNILLNHQSISRFHAVLQFRFSDNKLFLYDLGSTHGTFVNKLRLPARQFVEIPSQAIIKFGESSRLYVMHCPNEPANIEDEAVALGKKRKNVELKTQNHCSWGTYDYDDDDKDAKDNDSNENDSNENGDIFSGAKKSKAESKYRLNPKQYLRDWMTRNGLELYFETDSSEGIFKSHVSFQIDIPPFRINALGLGGNEKESQKEAALDACVKLDRLGLLNPNQNVKDNRGKDDEEEIDYYNNDDDNYLDKTDDKARRKMLKKDPEEVHSYESLCQKKTNILKEISDIKENLSKIISSEVQNGPGEDDDLDSYMKSLQSDLDKENQIRLGKQLENAEKELDQIEKLISLVKPTESMEYYSGKVAKNESLTSKSESLTFENEKSINHYSTSFKEKSIAIIDAAPSIPGRSRKERVYSVKMPPLSKINEKEDSQIEQIDPNDQIDQIDQIDENNQNEDIPSLPTSLKHSDWLPPSNQHGDGRTNLNDRLGY